MTQSIFVEKHVFVRNAFAELFLNRVATGRAAAAPTTPSNAAPIIPKRSLDQRQESRELRLRVPASRRRPHPLRHQPPRPWPGPFPVLPYR